MTLTASTLRHLSLRRRRRGGWRAERATGGVFAQGIGEHLPAEKPHPSALRASTLPALRAVEGDFAHMSRARAAEERAAP